MCQIAGEAQLSMEDLQTAYGKGFKALRDAANDCPACILATLRQFWNGRAPDEGHGWDHPANTERGEWDFKTACEEFWKPYNEERRSGNQYF
jgi:hypothetical protein